MGVGLKFVTPAYRNAKIVMCKGGGGAHKPFDDFSPGERIRTRAAGQNEDTPGSTGESTGPVLMALAISGTLKRCPQISFGPRRRRRRANN